MYAIKEALEPDPKKRLGSTWESFTQHEFFSPIDFVALERKEIEPVFIPSSEKTNFDATYDLEELLLEEAPLEARARRQKPREKLKEDATEKEIREDELYRMIETEFKPFDYTVATYKKYVLPHPAMRGFQGGANISSGSRSSSNNNNNKTNKRTPPAREIQRHKGMPQPRTSPKPSQPTRPRPAQPPPTVRRARNKKPPLRLPPRATAAAVTGSSARKATPNDAANQAACRRCRPTRKRTRPAKTVGAPAAAAAVGRA